MEENKGNEQEEKDTVNVKVMFVFHANSITTETQDNGHLRIVKAVAKVISVFPRPLTERNAGPRRLLQWGRKKSFSIRKDQKREKGQKFVD